MVCIPAKLSAIFSPTPVGTYRPPCPEGTKAPCLATRGVGRLIGAALLDDKPLCPEHEGFCSHPVLRPEGPSALVPTSPRGVNLQLLKEMACTHFVNQLHAFPNTLVMKEIQSGTEPEEEKNLQPMLEKGKKRPQGLSAPKSGGAGGRAPRCNGTSKGHAPTGRVAPGWGSPEITGVACALVPRPNVPSVGLSWEGHHTAVWGACVCV